MLGNVIYEYHRFVQLRKLSNIARTADHNMKGRVSC